MRLNADFADLEAAIRRMGATPIPFNTGAEISGRPPIDRELEEGIEVLDLSEVETIHGLLQYKGRQVMLYIQDHGGNVESALADGSMGRKFHVADCQTLKRMRDEGRYERYRVTNNLDGEFFITGMNWKTGHVHDGSTRLNVCQNCLKALNYKGAKHGHVKELVDDFSIHEFFAAYCAFFTYLPTRQAGSSEDDRYSEDWPRISAGVKVDRDFRCEECHVRLSENRKLLHVHHRNGVKGDNRQVNLKALCIACHREQPQHGHMCVSRTEMQTINRLRRDQGLLRDAGWTCVMDFCDPGLRGALESCQRAGAIAPIIGHSIAAAGGKIWAAVDAAWEVAKVGISIGEGDAQAARTAGWRIWSTIDVIERTSEFVAATRRRV